MLELANKGALLIGSKRIGSIIGHRLAAEGMNLGIVYRKSRTAAEQLYRDVTPMTKRICLLQGDMGVEADVKRVIELALQELEGLSFIINLASEYPKNPFHTLTTKEWDESMNAAKASYLLSVHGARTMMNNPGPTRGHIILFSDWAAKNTPYRDYVPYLTSKAAIDFMTRAFAVELAPHGILVNAIAPGPTIRPRGISKRNWEQNVVGQTPLTRESSAEDISEMVITLLKSETITGETIRIDSGRHLAGPNAKV